MAFLKVLSQLLVKKKKTGQIAVIGSAKSGKTTLIRFLESGMEIDETYGPTFGVEFRKKPLNIDGWQIQVVDVGGQDIYRKNLWEMVINQSNLIVYVIDVSLTNNSPEMNPSNTNENITLEQSIFNFNYTTQIIQGKNTPIVILLNKIDLFKSNEIDSIVTKCFKDYNIAELTKNKITNTFLPTSAKKGTNVEAALTWLANNLNEKDKSSG